MPQQLEVHFVAASAAPQGALVLLAGADFALGATAKGYDERTKGMLTRAAHAAEFKAKGKGAIEVLAPAGIDVPRIVVAAASSTSKELDRLLLGGYVYAQAAARKGEAATIVADLADPGSVSPEALAVDLALGALLRSYTFRKYRTKKPEEGEGEATPARDGLSRLVIACAKPDAAAKSFALRKAIVDGVFLARDLVNEPANALGPVEFADRLAELREAGLEVEVLEEAQLAELKMGALLGVAQGSVRPARVVVMQWHGAKSKRAKPVCFVGKGVVFDTGGISMKPAAGMEDMKGDMGGAACVSGLMLALAGRKAAVNAIGLVGIVENMPSGNAQRPGDIVTSMSGQTIEVINTDAEGRLVLADVMWYAQERFKPRFLIDLATLTGAIMVALGKEYAGMFSNDDKLAEELAKAGEVTGEKVWRMPLAKAYDKMIDSKTADMKNIGGRNGGAITAAQFLQRFIKDTPWIHLDVAGTAMDSVKSDISQGWASGWGVRLLDRLVADHYEKPEK